MSFSCSNIQDSQYYLHNSGRKVGEKPSGDLTKCVVTWYCWGPPTTPCAQESETAYLAVHSGCLLPIYSALLPTDPEILPPDPWEFSSFCLHWSHGRMNQCGGEVLMWMAVPVIGIKDPPPCSAEPWANCQSCISNHFYNCWVCLLTRLWASWADTVSLSHLFHL